MPTKCEHYCDRCGEGPLDGGPYHDGQIYMSSTNNRRDLGLDADVVFCDPCYREWHRGMKAWMNGSAISVKKPSDRQIDVTVHSSDADADEFAAGLRRGYEEGRYGRH